MLLHRGRLRAEPPRASRKVSDNCLSDRLAAGRERQFGPAIEQFREVLRTKPAYAEADNNLGNALSDEGRTDEAIVVYRQALKLDPAYPQAHNDLGNALQLQGKLDEAASRYVYVAARRPEIAGIHSNLGIVLQAQGKLEAAVASFERALKLSPNSEHAQEIKQILGTLGG